MRDMAWCKIHSHKNLTNYCGNIKSDKFYKTESDCINEPSYCGSKHYDFDKENISERLN